MTGEVTITYFAVHGPNGMWFNNHAFPAEDFTGSPSYGAALNAARADREAAGEGSVIYLVRKQVVR